MEWDSEMPPWDLPEIDQSSGEANLSLDCSVDLKLGSLGGFEWAENLKEQRRASTAAASFSKRPRAPSNGGQNALCLVDDCKSDLSGCREYHRRHKVCELHSKTPIVKVGGQEQRFCQQCSRFHLLIEFDDVKRSCRKRLDGHNRRRRKWQPEPTNEEILFPNHHGFRLISYPPNLPSTSIESTFINMTKTEERTCHARQFPLKLHFTDWQYFATAVNESLEKGKQFPFLKDGGNMALNNKMAKEKAPLCHPISNTVSSESSNSNNKLILSDRLPLIINSNCALSLLSPSTQTSAINPDHVVPSDRIPIGQPLISNQQDSGFSCSEVENLEMVEVPDAGMLQVVDGGTYATSENNSIYWL